MADASTLPPTPGDPRPPAPLFRSSAEQRYVSPDQLDLTASVVRPATWLILATVALAVLGGVVAGFLIRVPVKVTAEGILLSSAGVREIVAATRGQVKSLLVRVGDRVGEGDIIAQVEQPELKQEIDVASAELQDAVGQLKQFEDYQGRAQQLEQDLRAKQRAAAKASVGFSQQKVQLTRERLASTEDLAAKGFSSRQRVIDTQLELTTAIEEESRVRNQLQAFDLEEAKSNNDRERERVGLQIRLSTADRKVSQLQQRLGRVDIVKSPYSGVVAELKVNEGEIIEQASPLVILLPDQGLQGGGARQKRTVPLVATLYVSPADGKRVQAGMAAQIMPANARRQENGFILSSVTSVAEVPASLDGMKRVLKNAKLAETLAAEGAPFEIKASVELDPETPSGLRWSTSRGPSTPITVGTPCKAEVILRNEPVVFSVLPVLRQIFGRPE